MWAFLGIPALIGAIVTWFQGVAAVMIAYVTVNGTVQAAKIGGMFLMIAVFVGVVNVTIVTITNAINGYQWGAFAMAILPPNTGLIISISIGVSVARWVNDVGMAAIDK